MTHNQAISRVLQNKRSGFLAFIPALVAVALFHLSHVNGTWLISPDSTAYVEGARSLAQGKGYADSTGRAITVFPPGTSILLSIAAVFPRDDYLYFNLLMKCVLLGYLILTYLFLKKAQGPMFALLGFLLLSFSMVPILESTKILSDIPFAFIVALILFLFHPEELQDPSLKQAVLLGFLVTLSYFVRTEGVYLFAAYFLYILAGVKKNKIRTLAAYSCIFLLGAFFWWFRNSQYPGRVSYMIFLQKDPWVVDSGIATMSDWQERFLRNGLRQIATIGKAFSNQYDSFYLGLSLVGLAAAGLVRRDQYSLLCFAILLCYVPVHMVPENFQDRYMISLLPVLLLLFLKAFRGFTELFKEGIARTAVLSALLLLLAVSPYWFMGYRLAKTINERSKRAVETPILFSSNPEFQRLVLEYNPKLTSRDRIGSMHSNILRYMAPPEIPLTDFGLFANAENSYHDMRKKGITHFYVDMKSQRAAYMLAVVNQYSPSFILVSSNKAAAIYKTRFDSEE